MKANSVSWEVGLMEDLQDPEIAKGYVDACLEEGISLEEAIGDVVRAQGVNKVARRIHLGRPNLIRALRPKANPTVTTLRRVLNGVGLDISVRYLKAPKTTKRKRVAKAA